MPLFGRLHGGGGGVRTKDQADVDPHSWKLPSSYSHSEAGAKRTVIPDPKVFANAFIPDEPDPGIIETVLVYPDASHAAVHLALLECFRGLRLSASALDVKVVQPPPYDEAPGLISSSGPTRLPESQRWDLLIKLAVTRFTAWWSNIDHVLDHARAYSHHASNEVAVQLAKDYLPPLDVLLVWYALMLNSEAYDAACRAREGDVARLQNLCFPWPAVRDLIDMDKMEFSLPRAAQILFTNLSSQSCDILTYLESPPAYTDAGRVRFETDLFSEVKKQEIFIDESHGLLWIRSPALQGSLARASLDYLDFQLRRPTAVAGDAAERQSFGVNLLWRTHRLFPRQYKAFLSKVMNSQAPPTIDSEDSKRASNISLDAGGQYPVPGQCRCWTCERIRDDLPAFVHTAPPYSSSPSSSSAAAATPNAMQQQLSSLSSDQLRQIQDDLGFYHAVESARRRKAPLPVRPPTAAEREAESIAKERQKEVGYLPGLNEYIEVLPDGTRKIRRQKYAGIWGGAAWV
ncbi:E3 ubiquitin-protein ligase RNF14 [Pleurostoma richardsiae]|uniref:E3 ubiquitin-protein ligase RNF14 n=1 Tax=Pleurostoma richardsiae TaxID=41990 RepID=A0AA38VM02_9PEZI|nr:E3 ubiquitin-protein ligase RNF14 [Pleurostoma richardsiae]